MDIMKNGEIGQGEGLMDAKLKKLNSSKEKSYSQYSKGSNSTNKYSSKKWFSYDCYSQP